MEDKKQEEHEYELMPVSPLRKLEKRMERIESSKGIDTTEFYKEIVDIVRINQQIVDELAKGNDALRIELSRLPAKLEGLISRMDELISFIKASGTATEEIQAMGPEALKPLADKFDSLLEATKKIYESNQSMVNVLDEIDKKMRRPGPPPFSPPGGPPIRKPLSYSKPI